MLYIDFFGLLQVLELIRNLNKFYGQKKLSERFLLNRKLGDGTTQHKKNTHKGNRINARQRKPLAVVGIVQWLLELL